MQNLIENFKTLVKKVAYESGKITSDDLLLLVKVQDLLTQTSNLSIATSAAQEKELKSAETFAFASTNEPTDLLRHWFRKGFNMGYSNSAPAQDTAAVPRGMQLVNAGALQMVVNALRRDAQEGKVVRGEMANELLGMKVDSDIQMTPCPSCGITGIHACTGAPIAPMTLEESEKLDRVMNEIFQEAKLRAKAPAQVGQLRIGKTGFSVDIEHWAIRDLNKGNHTLFIQPAR